LVIGYLAHGLWNQRAYAGKALKKSIVEGDAEQVQGDTWARLESDFPRRKVSLRIESQWLSYSLPADDEGSIPFTRSKSFQ
jgi:hypothetical protein